MLKVKYKDKETYSKIKLEHMNKNFNLPLLVTNEISKLIKDKIVYL